MSDFGDDVGNVFENTVSTLLQRFLWQTQNGNYQRHASTLQDNQTPPNFQSKAQPDIVCTIPFENSQERDIVASVLREQGISVDSVVIQSPAIAVNQRDISKIQTVVEDYIKSHDGMDKNPSTPGVERDPEYILSHDGADKDTTTMQVEKDPTIADFSWKDDIAARVRDAREGAASEAEFVERVEAQGVKVSEAKDGELMFVHPKHDHWKVRGDTLGERYTRASFKEDEYNLNKEALEAREASKQLSAERGISAPDRDVPSFQSLSK